MDNSKAIFLAGSDRGIFGNEFFRIQSVMSNGIPGTGRPENFGPLVVFNDDIVSPEGFLGLHPHQNIEVIAIVLEGSEFQKDDKGEEAELTADDVQLISSGTGIRHSAGNPSAVKFARNLQIWIQPREKNTAPNIQTKTASANAKKNEWMLQISPDGREESLIVLQDAWLSKGRFDAKTKPEYNLFSPGNGVMVYLIDGKIEVNGIVLESHDTALFFETDKLLFHIIEDAHIQLIETDPKRG